VSKPKPKKRKPRRVVLGWLPPGAKAQILGLSYEGGMIPLSFANDSRKRVVFIVEQQ